MENIDRFVINNIIIEINLYQWTDCTDERFYYYLVTVNNNNIKNTKEWYFFSKKYEKSYQREWYARRYFNKLKLIFN